ncbi:hypothetical protein AB8P55_20710, partial [Yersinia enterocolitica]
MRAIYPCGMGCAGKRLNGSNRKNDKRTGEKTSPCIAGLSAPWFAAATSVSPLEQSGSSKTKFSKAKTDIYQTVT